MIDQTTTQRIKDKADILEVVSDFVQLKKKGSQYFGLSPFAEERTPSFVVVPSKQIFKCFSTGKGGDSIEFLIMVCNFTFAQALQYLGKKYQVEIDGCDNISLEQNKPRLLKAIIPTSFIHPNVLLSTLQGYESNNLFKFLAQKFDQAKLLNQFKKYYIGIDQSSSYTKDWVIFWQVDSETMVRSGKMMKYGEDGRRLKSCATSWVHSMQRNQQPVYSDFNLKQCFFGEHLISEDVRKTIAIVESEKTALVASLMIPNYYWIACGSKNGLGVEKCEILKNRSVTLFPDLDAHEEWVFKAKEHGFNVSTHLFDNATDEERKTKMDIADFLLR